MDENWKQKCALNLPCKNSFWLGNRWIFIVDTICLCYGVGLDVFHLKKSEDLQIIKKSYKIAEKRDFCQILRVFLILETESCLISSPQTFFSYYTVLTNRGEKSHLL